MAITGLTGAPVHKGSWLGLPDFGVTEVLKGQPRAQSGSVLGTSSGPLASSAPQKSYSAVNYNWQPSPVKQVTYPTGGGTGQPSGGFDVSQFTSGLQDPNAQLGGGASQTDIINQQFNDFNNYLNQQEGMARSGFDETKGLYDTQKANAEKQYTTEKTQQTEGIKKTENLNLAKVRQLLADLQQSNAARSAITGGGSADEALSYRFGREAQSRLGNVMDQSQQAIERVNTFYDQAITKLNDSYQANIVQARQALDENLAQIGYQRNASATAKQQSTLQAWQEYYNNVNQAKIQAATFKTQYDLWKQQQDTALAATSDFSLDSANTYNQGLQQSYNPVEKAPIAANQTYDPNINPYFSPLKKKTTPEEEQRALVLGGGGGGSF